MTTTDGAKLHTPTLGLYLKLTAVMVPTFLLFAAGGFVVDKRKEPAAQRRGHGDADWQCHRSRRRRA